MKTKFLLFYFFLFASIVYSQTPTFSWVNQTNAAAEGNVTVSDSENDIFGNLIVTGSFFNTATFGSASYSATSGPHSYIAKLDHVGNFIWTKSISSSGRIFSYSVTTDAQGSIYLVGNFNGTATFGTTALISGDNHGSGSVTTSFICKLNAQGDFLWARKIEKSGSLRVGVDAEGNLLFFTRFSGYLTVDQVAVTGNNDFLILKLNSNDGSAIFGKVITDTGDGSFFRPSLTTDSSNNIYLACSFTNSAIIGETTITGNSTASILIAKLDNNGNLVWAKAVGGNADDYGQEIMLDSEKNVYISGNYFSNSLDFEGHTIYNNGGLESYLTKMDNAGNFLWAKSYGSNSDDLFYHSVVDADGNTFLTYGSSVSAYTANLSKIANNGATVWNKVIPNAGVKSLSLDSSQNLYCAGIFKNTINVDGFLLQSISANDVFFGKLDTYLYTDEIDDQSFSIGPIPVNNDILISAKKEENFSVSIFDLNGRKILTRNNLEKNARIDLSRLTPGTYILTISTQYKTVNKKIIKK